MVETVCCKVAGDAAKDEIRSRVNSHSLEKLASGRMRCGGIATVLSKSLEKRRLFASA